MGENFFPLLEGNIAWDGIYLSGFATCETTCKAVGIWLMMKI
jgi:hypothetical protein